MSKGSYEAFRDALRAFESGWDRERYDAGIIQDWQLDQWAGGPVGEFYPQYTSWGALTEAEWDAMSYRSMNSLGFVGYQFGEALLIDLGYYDDDVFYGAGAATNTWDGTWTGKNGVTSLDDFMTADAQEVAIQEAFGFNLRIIRDGLAQSGQSLDALIGTTGSYVQNGETVEVELTLTGIMAAAHLRGAYGTLALLQGGSVSTDEFGTSILQYIDQFGGYDAPSIEASIAFFEDRLTGDEGLGTPGGGGEQGGGDDTPAPAPAPDEQDLGNGSANVTKETADVVITWSWGQDTIVNDFDAASSTIFIDWIGADALEVSEVDGSVVFAVPSNNQTTTLAGITLADLSADNFTILDDTAANEVLAL
ncbi:MAG: 1,4-beta-glucanase, partial [Pseudomonadota bacterium]